jgi:heat shock protein HslJ
MVRAARLCVALAILVAAVAACGDDEPGVFEFPDREWNVVGIEGETVEAPPAGTPVTLLVQDGTISGTSGCNRYSGAVSVDGSSIEVADELILTKMACSETQDWDPFLDLLPQATDFTQDGDTVVINTSAGSSIILE